MELLARLQKVSSDPPSANVSLLSGREPQETERSSAGGRHATAAAGDAVQVWCTQPEFSVPNSGRLGKWGGWDLNPYQITLSGF